MTEPSVPPRPGWASQLRLLLLAAAGVVAVGAAVVLGMRDAAERPAPGQTAAGTPSSVTSRSGPPEAAAAPSAKPGFDIVRVNPEGDTVMAGHAPPGSEVRIEEAGREIGRAQADQRGEWVFVPTEPLPPGARAFSLTARSADGTETASDGTVLLAIPEHGQARAPVAVLSTAEAPPKILQSDAGNAPGLGLEAAEYDEHGTLRLTGRAQPGATVRVYLDDKPAGDARADRQGTWTLSPGGVLAQGDHRVRLDEIGPDGQVIARALAPLPRESIAGADLAADHVVVQRGQTLWRLARQAYGNGMRYTVIYEANRGQIQNPDRIYPGEAIAVPALRGTR